VNIIYSGTVSAATEGTLLDVPSIAVSLTTYEPADFRPAARFAKRLALHVLRTGLPAGTLLNVNVPAVSASKIRGVKITRQGSSRWDDTFDMRVDPNNRTYYWLTGKLDVLDTTDDTDVIAVRKNYISVSPIQYDLTDYRTLKSIRSWKLPRS
jgi:5'-nucleotidase